MADTELDKERARLSKLWDAYEAQEQELDEAIKKVEELQEKLADKKRVSRSLRKLVEERDKELRSLQEKVTTLQTAHTDLKVERQHLKSSLEAERDRYTKLYAITEEIEEELDRATNELEARDYWFQEHFTNLRMLDKALKDREKMVQLVRSTGTFDKNKLAMELESPDTIYKPSSNVQFEVLNNEENEQDEDLFDTSSSGKSKAGTGNTKDDVIKTFTNLESVKPDIAQKLYAAGFITMDQLREASKDDLVKVDGISPTLARQIRTDLF